MICYCPQCKQKYEVDDAYAGNIVTCSACGDSFSIPFSAESVAEAKEENPVSVGSQPKRNKIYVKPRQSTLSSRPTPPPSVTVLQAKQGALIGAAVCLILAALFNLFTNFLIFLFAPLYFAAFILSIVAMAQRRVLGGVLVLILTVLLPLIISSFNIARATQSIGKAIDEAIEEVQKAPLPSEASAVGGNAVRGQSASIPKEKPASEKKELKGLCGINFGDRLRVLPDSRTEKTTDGDVLYFFDPTKPFMMFDQYFVRITPTSNRVYCIWLIKEFKESKGAEEEFKRVDTVLENHYGVKGKGAQIKTYPFDNGRISLRYERRYNGSTLDLRGYCTEFEEMNRLEKAAIEAEKTKARMKAEQEKKDAIIRNTDTSAL